MNATLHNRDKVWQILTSDFCHIADFCGILYPLRLSWTSHTEVLTIKLLLKIGHAKVALLYLHHNNTIKNI